MLYPDNYCEWLLKKWKVLYGWTRPECKCECCHKWKNV